MIEKIWQAKARAVLDKHTVNDDPVSTIAAVAEALQQADEDARIQMTAAAERHRDVAADRLKDLITLQAEAAALREGIAETSNALFNGTKALQQFQSGSEARKLQEAVDNAQRRLCLTGQVPRGEWVQRIERLVSACKALERACRAEPERTWDSPWTQGEADAFGLVDEALSEWSIE